MAHSTARQRETKRTLRGLAAARNRKLFAEQGKSPAVLAATAELLASSAWQDSQQILLSYPLPDEFPILQLVEAALRAGKKLALPYFESAKMQFSAWDGSEESLHAGRYGIRCPAQPVRVRLAANSTCIVPGLSFSTTGYRLGRGGGHYDMFIAAELSSGARFVSVCLEVQLSSTLPVEAHDRRLDMLFTETRTLSFAR